MLNQTLCQALTNNNQNTPNSPQQFLLPIDGVIFDLDGVLTDTAEYHYLAWQKVADENNIPFNRDANESMRGLSRSNSLRRLLGNQEVTPEKFQEMMESKNSYYLQFIQGITPADILPGVFQLLDDLRHAGIKIAIGSVSKNAKQVIDKLGITDKIDAIADGYSVQKNKPAPDLFLYAAHLLGLSPAHCLVVEDATAGIEAALAAGMWAVGLGPINRVGNAHIVLPNLAGIYWADLQSLLLQIQPT